MRIFTAVIDSPHESQPNAIVYLTEEEIPGDLADRYAKDNGFEGPDEEAIAYITEHGFTVTIDSHILPNLAVMLRGDPVNGLQVYGPYADEETAVVAGDSVTDEWWVTDLKEPEAERCPVCGQPDNCGDCDHTPLTRAELARLGDAE